MLLIAKCGSSNAGYKSQKWIADIKGTDKSPLAYVGRKTKLKEDRMNKRYLSSPTPFATSGKTTYLHYC